MEKFNFDDKYLLLLLNRDPDAEKWFVNHLAEYLKNRLRSEKELEPWIDDLQQEIFMRTFREIRNKAVHSPAEVDDLIQTIFQEKLAKIRQNILKMESDLPPVNTSDEFNITFGPDLSANQIKLTLNALADYYRECGGIGLAIEFELEEIRILELAHV